MLPKSVLLLVVEDSQPNTILSLLPCYQANNRVCWVSTESDQREADPGWGGVWRGEAAQYSPGPQLGTPPHWLDLSSLHFSVSPLPQCASLKPIFPSLQGEYLNTLKKYIFKPIFDQFFLFSAADILLNQDVTVKLWELWVCSALRVHPLHRLDILKMTFLAQLGSTFQIKAKYYIHRWEKMVVRILCFLTENW